MQSAKRYAVIKISVSNIVPGLRFWNAKLQESSAWLHIVSAKFNPLDISLHEQFVSQPGDEAGWHLAGIYHKFSVTSFHD
ncbi:MAG: hypothetical protein BGP14_10745 [Sphingobacteriales bacterium 44-15]|nr:MAG: hypothetical protein BGP14_10745 [Sphingobacteriales bacterium 44-15]